jgi:HAD superfamily hydrolase (TIGR01509 family)
MFDTGNANRMYYNRVLRHMGKADMTDGQFAFVHMHTVDESIALLFPDPSEYRAAQDFRISMSYGDFIPHMLPEPYLKKLLQRLRPRYKTAIATNRSDTMPRVLAEFGLENDFDMVVTSLDVKHPKPHPEELLRILTAFRLSASQAVYVGDSKVDEMAAKSADMTFIACKNKDLSADFHIESLKEMENILGLQE